MENRVKSMEKVFLFSDQDAADIGYNDKIGSAVQALQSRLQVCILSLFFCMLGKFS